MTAHSIFYYPYSDLYNGQVPLLKAAALYFDKLYLLDPEKATGGIGLGKSIAEVRLLRAAGILEPISPEEVLLRFEDQISAGIQADMKDPEYLELCASQGRAESWTLALAKVPKKIRADAKFATLDRAMQRFLREIPRSVSSEVAQYAERYEEGRAYPPPPIVTSYAEGHAEGWDVSPLEYRWASYPLPLGEAIMMNHALVGALLHTDATPITDDPFHRRILDFKIQRALQTRAVQEVLEDRARIQGHRGARLAAAAIQDREIDLPAMSPQLPLATLLEYRSKHGDELAEAREKLSSIARRIRQDPWDETFDDELEHNVLPDLADTLREVQRSRDAWLRRRGPRAALAGTGIALSGATAVIGLALAPAVVPLAAIGAVLGLAGSVAIPGLQAVRDWREGNAESSQPGGLSYLLGYR